MMNLIGASVGGWVGWWLGEQIDLPWAMFLSLVGSAVGLFLGRRLLTRFLDC